MNAYIKISLKSFKNSFVYRMDYIAGVLNTVLMAIVSIAIWKAIYGDGSAISGIELKSLITYIVLSFFLQSAFSLDEYYLEEKIQTGLITSDLLKPTNYFYHMLSYHIGGLLFKICLQAIPALIILSLISPIMMPFSPLMGLLFIISAGFGFFIVYFLSFIIWLSAFRFYYSFSLITIKDALIVILSGAFLPLWFLPTGLVEFVKMTPFESIYFIPISIYLGQIPYNEILWALGKQLVWLAGLFIASKSLWRVACKKLQVQGG